MNENNCINCGADKGLHNYKSLKCPVGGREAPIDQKPKWMDTIYENTVTQTDDKPDNPRAFPCPDRGLHGMTLRDYFATKAMQGLIIESQISDKAIPKSAYNIADGMLKERTKK